MLHVRTQKHKTPTACFVSSFLVVDMAGGRVRSFERGREPSPRTKKLDNLCGVKNLNSAHGE